MTTINNENINNYSSIEPEKKQCECDPLQSIYKIVNEIPPNQNNKIYIIIIVILIILLTISITLLFITYFTKSKPKNIPKIISYGNSNDITYIFGHKNPDTDTICSAIIASELEKLLGNKNEIIPCRLGELNLETKYVLEYFNISEPILITNISKAKNIILVDHNKKMDSIDDLNETKVLKIYDHHSFNFNGINPIQIITKPYGSTTSILYEIYKFYNFEINKKIAGLMLSGILSDTLIFHSSTATEYDKIYAKELAKILNINYEDYGKKLLEKICDIAGKTIKELITRDAKLYESTIKKYLYKISRVKVMNYEELTNKKDEYLIEMNKEINEKGYELYLVCFVNVVEFNCKCIVSGDKKNVVEKAFNVVLENDVADLKDKINRKIDIQPPIDKELDIL